MITEDYVSFEVAKLLKEKGFNEYCLRNYWITDKELHNWSWELSYQRNSDRNRNTRDCAAPTLQMARKWIRLTYKIHIRILEDTLGTIYEWQIYKDGVCQKHSFIEDSYEKALDTAIKYCLTNLI